MTLQTSLLFVLLLFVSACMSSTPITPCEEASQHLMDCAVTQVPLPKDCQVQDANEILALSCQELTNPGKADLFADVLCRSGLLFKCEVTACSQGEIEGFDEWDNCGAYISTPEQSDCASCDYYRCRNAISEISCNEDPNYYTEFGNRYCLKYAQLTESKLSNEGQDWSRRIRTCLMEFAEENISNNDTCVDVQSMAIESHTDCYVNTGFCSLPITDWLKVLTTIDPGDFHLRSALVTGISCLKEYSDENPSVLEPPR